MFIFCPFSAAFLLSGFFLPSSSPHNRNRFFPFIVINFPFHPSLHHTVGHDKTSPSRWRRSVVLIYGFDLISKQRRAEKKSIWPKKKPFSRFSQLTSTLQVLIYLPLHPHAFLRIWDCVFYEKKFKYHEWDDAREQPWMDVIFTP